MARLSARPRDAKFSIDSRVLLLDGSGSITQFRRVGDTWQAEDLSLVGPDSILAPPGATLVSSPDGPMLWDPASAVLHPLLEPFPRAVHVPLQRPTEVFVPGTEGGMPRHHGRLLLSGKEMIFERRVFRPETDSITTQGYLVHSNTDFQREDTLYSFLASGYGQRTGGVMVCCGRPLVFSPQAHWLLAKNDRVVFSSGDENALLLLPLRDGIDLDSLSLPIEPRRVRDWDILRYVLHQARTRQDWSRGRVFRYSLQALRSIDYLRQGFSTRTPLVTQLFSVEENEIWVRHFDPRSWEFGLSELWTVVDLETQANVVVRIPDLGLVHDIKRMGNEVKFLSSTSWDSGERFLGVSTYLEPHRGSA